MLKLEGGGPLATELVAARRLGVQAGFVGTYGGDRMGSVKIQTLAEESVDVSRSVNIWAADRESPVLMKPSIFLSREGVKSGDALAG